VGSFFINYCVENANYSDSAASNLLSYALITFTGGRFVGVAVAHFFQTDFVLLVYAVITTLCAILISVVHGVGGVGLLIILYFFESLMYPSIFVLGTANLGPNTRRGAGILVMGVSGGAVFPPIQGAVADSATTRISFLVPMFGYLIVLAYAIFHWVTHGFKIKKDRQAAEVIVVAIPGQKKSSVFVSSDPVDVIVEHQRKRTTIDDFKRLDEGNVELGSVTNPSRGTSMYNPHNTRYTNELFPPSADF